MKRIIPAILVLLATASGCTKHITQFNTDPEASITAPSASVFLAGEKGLADIYTADNWSSAPFRVIAQVWTMNTYNNITHYSFATDNPMGGWWTALYTNTLSNLAQAKTLYAADVLDSNVRRNDYIITDILEVYAYSLLVNTFGNVPYSQALDRTIPFPAYDDAKTIETDLLNRLDTSIAGLNPCLWLPSVRPTRSTRAISPNGKNSRQPSNSSSPSLSPTSIASTAATRVQEAVATGVFSANTDNALLPYDASSVVNSNPIWQDLVNGANLHYYSPRVLFHQHTRGVERPTAAALVYAGARWRLFRRYRRCRQYRDDAFVLLGPMAGRSLPRRSPRLCRDTVPAGRGRGTRDTRRRHSREVTMIAP